MLGAIRRSCIVVSWRRRLSVLLVTSTLPLVAAGAQLAPGPLLPAAFAAHRLAVGGDCSAVDPSTAGAAALRPLPPSLELNLADQLDSAGELVGRRLELTTATGSPSSVDLPVESSVAEPIGELLVYTEVPTGALSEIHGLDLVSGCDTLLATNDEVVRSAVIDPAGSALYVHSVSRAGRDDIGILRIDLLTGRGTSVMPPLPDSDAMGPTFGTGLYWSSAGDALAVQSCGFSSCRTRVIDVSSGAVSTYDAAGQGQFIGLTARHLVTYADCPGLPCAVLSARLAGGQVASVASGALNAALVRDAAGRDLLRIETATAIEEVEQ
jgi:hypothetical protein